MKLKYNNGSTLVFVYGSLKSGYYNHQLLETSEYVGYHTTEPKYTMLNLGCFPAVIEGGNTAISGELYEVSNKVLVDLDILEGVPSLYHRGTINTKYGEAIIYILTNNHFIDNKSIVKTGVWIESIEY